MVTSSQEVALQVVQQAIAALAIWAKPDNQLPFQKKAFDVYQCFCAYTVNNPDITLSGGISIDDIKLPLYQAAKSSGEAENKAKANGRDSLGLFAQVFKLDEWLEIEDINFFEPEVKKYLHPENTPKLLGVLPLVKKLEAQNVTTLTIPDYMK